MDQKIFTFSVKGNASPSFSKESSNLGKFLHKISDLAGQRRFMKSWFEPQSLSDNENDFAPIAPYGP